jgi:hypothetical protein
MARSKRRPLKGRRFTDAHSDGKLRTLIKTIVRTYNLPTGSVWIVRPDRKRMRRDATVGTLWKAWS